jgi:hypothetical protein
MPLPLTVLKTLTPESGNSNAANKDPALSSTRMIVMVMIMILVVVV